MGTLIIVSKVLLITLAITLPILMLLWRRRSAGSIILPHARVVCAASFLPLAYLLSMIFARDKFNALLGLGFDTDSLIMVSLGVLSMLLVLLASINNTFLQKVDIGKIIMWFSGVVASLFFAQVLWQIIFSNTPVWLTLLNPVNSWVDVAILLALLITSMLAVNSTTKVVSRGGLYARASILLLLVIVLGVFLHITTILTLLFVLSAVQIITIVAKNGESLKRTALLLPGIVLVVSGLFLLDDTLLNGKVTAIAQSVVKVSFIDIRPNWQGTVTVAKGSLENATLNEKLFGPGVGSFADQWRVYKPATVNITRFWSSNFNYAVGFIPTTAITGGVVVFAAWIIFFFFLIRLLFLARSSKLALPTLFVWLVMLFNPVDYLLLIIAFVLTGALIRDAINLELIKIHKFKFRGEEKNKIVTYVVLPVLVFISVGSILVVAHRVALNTYLVRASAAMLENNYNKAEQLLSKANILADLDIIEQGYTRVAFTKLITLLEEAQQDKKDVDPEALQAALSNVLSHARSAIERDPTDPVNYMALGGVSEQLMGLGINGAKESAEAAYLQAMALDPLNPSIPFALARINAQDEDKTKFIKYLEQALIVKPNYVPALYQYALVQLANGNKEAAQQLFVSIINIDNNNANALYYLASLYLEQGRIEEALMLMQRVQLLNPNNKNVTQIVDSLKAKLQQEKSTSTNQVKPEDTQNEDSPTDQ